MAQQWHDAMRIDAHRIDGSDATATSEAASLLVLA